MTLTAFIFARAGSKGLPGKNIKLLAGKPLIGWSIEQALNVPEISRVIVSTDSEEIAEIGRYYGAQAPFLRPSALAEDTSSEWDAWRHALEFLLETEGSMPAPFISVPTTSPLRNSSDIANCLALYNQGGTDVAVAVTEAHRNPWFNMVLERENATIVPVNNPDGAILRRQDAPPVRDMTTTAYVADPHYIMTQKSLFAGRVRAVHVPVERSVDIDTPLDFEIAEFLMKKRLDKL